MTSTRFLSAACAVLLGATTALGQAPANDDCGNAISVGLGLTPFDSTLATDGAGLPLDPLVCDMGIFGDEQLYQDVWFSFAPGATGTYDIASVNNGNPTFDSRIAVYDQATCPDVPANVILCDDDAGPALEAAVSGFLNSGSTYLIRIGSYDATVVEQPAALSIAFVGGPPANDVCANAVSVGLGLTSYDNSTASTAGSALDPLVCDVGAAGDEQIYSDLWYTFTPATTDFYDIECVNNGNPSYDSRIAIYDQAGCPDDPANVVACDDDSGPGLEAAAISVPLVGGTQYLIRVGSFDSNTAEELAALSVSVGVAPPMTPANDDCANAQVVTVGLTSFDSTSATDGSGLALDPLVCDMGTFGDEQLYADVWFSFTPGMSGVYSIASVNNGNPTFDSRIAVYDQAGCPDDPANVIACDDDAGPGLEAATQANLTAGNTYLVRIGSYDPFVAAQPAALGIAFVGAPPANDDCANATPLTAFGVYPLDNALATTDGLSLAGFCNFSDPSTDDQAHFDVWYTYTPTVGGCTYISTLGLVTFDSRIAVYDSGSCPDDPTTVLACSDDENQPIQAPFEAGLDIDLTAGNTYLIRVGTYANFSPGGTGSIQIAAGPQAFLNDGGMQTGTSGCAPAPAFPDSCNGDGGDQLGCTDCPCGNNAPMGTVGGCLNSAGTASRLAASGDPSVSLPSGSTTDLRFTMSGGPAAATSVLLSGDAVAPQNMANPCFGLNSGSQAADRDGLRCAVQAVQRHGNRQTNASGDIMDPSGPNRVWGGEAQPTAGIAGASGFAAGQTRFFQVTHRDNPAAVCMRGLNTSQAVEVTFTP